MREAPPLSLSPWSARRSLVFDLVLTGVLLLLTLAVYLGVNESTAALLSALQIAPLCIRRLAPTTSYTLVVAATALQVPVLSHPIPGQVAIPVVVYTMTVYAPASRVRAALVIALLGGVVGPVQWYVSSFGDGLATLLLLVTVTELLVIAPWALGSLARTRRAYVAQIIERGQRLEREAVQRAELAASDERARIAREMHDVVAHSLSVMVVQADGARYLAAQDPATAAGALETIAATGRESLTEMRRVLGLLRSSDAATGTRPQPGLADVETLLAEAVATGMHLTSDVADRLPPVPPGVGLTIYRLVQEALTNVRKHAGPAAQVHVGLRYRPGELIVEVLDDGRGAAADGGTDGHGLLGMHERVRALGGRLRTGPRGGGGFEVAAVIPLPAPDGPGTPVPPAPGTRKNREAAS